MIGLIQFDDPIQNGVLRDWFTPIDVGVKIGSDSIVSSSPSKDGSNKASIVDQ